MTVPFFVTNFFQHGYCDKAEGRDIELRSFMSPSRFFISALSSSVLRDGCNDEGNSIDLANVG